MSKTSFYNYFKRKTGKMAINYINELRIAHTCKLLNQTKILLKLLTNAS